MSETNRKAYEAMFLFPQAASGNLGETVNHINGILDHAQAEVVAMKKWDERRLAYEIKKHKRGLYILVYFLCEPGGIATIERDSNLSEQILRVMIVRADHLTHEEMQAHDERQALADEAGMKAAAAEEKQQTAAAASEG